MGPKSNDALMRRERFDDTEETQDVESHTFDDRDRDWSDGSYKSLRVCWLQGKGCWTPAEAKRPRRNLSWSLRRQHGLDNSFLSDSWSPEL